MYSFQQRAIHGSWGKLIFVGLMAILLFIIVLSGIFNKSSEEQKDTAKAETAKQLSNGPVGTYKGFEIVWHDGQYYAMAVPVNLANRASLTACQANYECIVGQELKEVKRLVDILKPDLIKSVATSSSHPAFGDPWLLFDNVADPAHAWHSDQEPEFPQWIDIEFQEPVNLKVLGLQAQIGEGNQSWAPHNVVVLGGEDPEAADYKAELSFEFDQAGVLSFQELPQSTKKFQRYRILIMDNQQGQADFVTIQEMWLGILIEENYKGFNIFWGNGKFYVLNQTVESVASAQLAGFSPNTFQVFCVQNGGCGLTNTLEEAKRLTDQLN